MYYARRPPGLTDADMPYIMKSKCRHPIAMNVDGMDFSIWNYDQRVYFKHDHCETIVVAQAVDDFTILASTSSLKQ